MRYESADSPNEMRVLWIAFLLPAVLCGQLAQSAQVGRFYTFRYPQGWLLSSDGRTPALVPPPASDDGASSDMSIVFSYNADLREASNPRASAKALAGVTAGSETRLGETRGFRASEMSGWIHSGRIVNEDKSETLARVYALPLPGGGTALALVAGSSKALAVRQKEYEAIIGSISTRSAEMAPVTVTQKLPAWATNEPVKRGPPAPPRKTAAQLEAELAAEWTSLLSGRTWAAERRSYQFHADGRYDVVATVTIAGLNDSSPRRTSDSGTWKVVARGGAAFLAVESESGRTGLLACRRDGGRVIIDGDVMTAR